MRYRFQSSNIMIIIKKIELVLGRILLLRMLADEQVAVFATSESRLNSLIQAVELLKTI